MVRIHLQRSPGDAYRTRTLVYGLRFILPSCSILGLYLCYFQLSSLLTLIYRRDLDPSPLRPTRRASLQEIHPRGSENHEPETMEDDTIQIVVSTGCNAYQDCTFFFSLSLYSMAAAAI
jgi:hypothetical protein